MTGAATVAARTVAAASDIRDLTRTTFKYEGRVLPPPRYRPRPEPRRARAGTPAAGTVRKWMGLDDVAGTYYPKDYTLRAVGKHIEVWVANDLAFPKNDCRADTVEVSNAQVTTLVDEFDGTIYPRETAAFSTPPDRDGSHPTVPGDYHGDGDKTVTLVDNIRDANYFAFPQEITYIAGFFAPQLNEFFDRNVMTIDAYDWKHRMGAEPADDPTDEVCTSRPAHPRMYEATFAHEWQHLLEYYADPHEVTWVNEGLSDFAEVLTGYVNARATVYDPGPDLHLTCFQGFGMLRTANNPNPRDCGGPSNSLNLWDEGTTSTQTIADYGNAFEFMLYLRDRFGLGVITRLHRDGVHHGLEGLRAALPQGADLYDVLHDYQLMVLVDRAANQPGSTVIGVPARHVIAKDLNSTVNLANHMAWDPPGVPPNGADYVPLPTPVTSVDFQGARRLAPQPSGWTVAGKTFFSGNAANLDRATVHEITVPAKHPRLELLTAWAIDGGYDFGYVEISTDGGVTYHAVAGDRTVPGPLGPGLTGASDGTVTAGYDLSAYAGKKVLVALHYVTDEAVNRGGWRIGQIALNGQVISDGSSLDGWRSPTEIHPAEVHDWHVSLVGLDGNHVAICPADQFARLSGYPTVVAVVAYDEPTEKITQYAPYQLTVNGVLQPGGGPVSYVPGSGHD